jgi:hypothetical protein
MHVLFCLLLVAGGVDQADDAEIPPAPVAQPAPQPPAPPSTVPTVSVPPPSPTVLPPAPPGWRYQLTGAPLEHPRRWDLFTAGIVTFSGAWTATLMAGIPTFEVYLDIPLVGPLLEMSRFGSAGDPLVGLFDWLLISDALAQIGGVAMLIAGPATRKSKPAAPRLELVPLGAGVALRGAF